MRSFVIAVVALLVGSTVGAFAVGPAIDASEPPSPAPEPDDGWTAGNESALALTTADDAESFRSYVQRSQRLTASGPRWLGRDDAERATATEAAEATDGATGAATAKRVGTTNVQVAGVDEPDLVKTDGSRFYVQASEQYYREHDTAVVDVSTPANPEIASRIDRSGRMLQTGDSLLVLGRGHVTGYDVSSPANPAQSWERALNGSRIVTARLANGTAFFVVASDMPGEDCEVRPFDDVRVHCTEVEHPERPVPAEVTYTVVSVDASTGEVTASRSLVGSHDATVYASGDGLYLTYTERAPMAAVEAAFITSRSYIPNHVKQRVRDIRSYDLSPRAERIEIRATLRGWYRSMPADRREDVRERYRDELRSYLEEHKRNLTTTHVVRLSMASLETTAVGTVPGEPLNQFAFDAHEGSLRVATTVGGTGGTETENDVYVLDDDDLSVEGAVTGMSPGQRVYGVRFVGDTGYVITFRQVDPLHVLDLSDPEAPTEEGQLKLPGFSTYLHPLGDGRLLGIGEEDGQVKAVIFDVSDPENPSVERSRLLDARYSEVANTHHAFTRDAKHGVFFLPTEAGGYVLSETDLSTEREVDMEAPRRARYVGDYLYVFSDREVAVFDEQSWERVDTLSLEG